MTRPNRRVIFLCLKLLAINPINKMPTLTKNLAKFTFEWIDIKATDCPCILTNNETGETRHYGVGGDAWRLVGECRGWASELVDDPQKLLELVFYNYPSDITAIYP